jgi:hypothetical protein
MLTDDDWVRILGKDPLHFDLTGIDPHMIQSVAPRAGLPGPSSPDGTDPINGREWDTQLGDTQFACTFPLPTPKDCSLPQFLPACDCTPGKSPGLCDPTNNNLQVRGKAYPAIRELEVARALGSRAIVGSICPLQASDAYRPAMSALGNRMAKSIKPAE